MRIKDLFKDYDFPWEGKNMMVGRLPDFVLAELDNFVEQTRAIKDHPLGFMRLHANAGQNSYQISVPGAALEASFAMAYFNHLGEYFLSRIRGLPISQLVRKARFRRNDGHFDNYDFWINFASEGDTNPAHSHSGLVSSVIYITNDGLPTHFVNGVSFAGERGQILLFPAELMHWVETKETPGERVTMSFNLYDPAL